MNSHCIHHMFNRRCLYKRIFFEKCMKPWYRILTPSQRMQLSVGTWLTWLGEDSKQRIFWRIAEMFIIQTWASNDSILSFINFKRLTANWTLYEIFSHSRFGCFSHFKVCKPRRIFRSTLSYRYHTHRYIG